MSKRISLILFLFWLPMIMSAKISYSTPSPIGKITLNKVQIKDKRLFSVIDSVISSTVLSNDLDLWNDQYYYIDVFRPSIKSDSVFPQAYLFPDVEFSVSPYFSLYPEAYPDVDLTKYRSLRVKVVLGFYGCSPAQYVIPFNNRNYYSILYFTNIFGKTIGNVVENEYGILGACVFAGWYFTIEKGVITCIEHYYEVYEEKEIIYQNSCDIKIWDYTGTD